VPRRRYAARVHTPFSPPTAEPLGQRELAAVREIAHAFIRADRPEDVFQFALDRISPVVGASFASVYLTDGTSEVMRLVAAHNWPGKYRPWLGEIRMRVGFGPSGEAASERRMIEIADVCADPDLGDWHDVARELGFRAIVALPLQSADHVLGTVSFYFRDAASFTGDTRALKAARGDQRGYYVALRVVADQMAATAEKAARSDELRRTNAALAESNAELERQYVAVMRARLAKDEFLANVSEELHAPLATLTRFFAERRQGAPRLAPEAQGGDVEEAGAACEQLGALVEALVEFAALRRGALQLKIEEFDPRVPLRDAVQAATGVPAGVQLIVDEPVHAMPTLHSDRARITRILGTLLANALRFTSSGEVRTSVNVANGRVDYRVRDTGVGIEPAAQLLIFEEFRQLDEPSIRGAAGSGLGLALSRGLARLLGGDIDLVSAPGTGSTFTLNLPLSSNSLPIPDSLTS